MTQTAKVNYHVHKPERQAFQLDAGGIIGNLIAPEMTPTEVKVRDARKSHVDTSFQDDAVAFASFPTAVPFAQGDDTWQADYDAELTELLTTKLDAREVIIFDHTIRVDDPDAVRKPARNVHSDYSPEGAEQRLVDILGAENAAEWSAGHYAFINVWRPIEAPINSAPLGFILPSSVSPEDWILLDLIYPDRTGQIMGLAANPDHQWIYMSKMTPDEVAYFNIFDNRGRPSIGHSALDMVEDPKITTVRKSIESRTLVRFA
ncbi:CmcJ/NvfI family oxidoreductase [uncultured Roseobacter sp.]|uniref:CmcJ/NvfI family oxidoreductase n=1 Tax=uncultured Roseobacter sp. TaxID=114847 RepID=UPI00261B81B0|nr:CmcJ/NvfI family oxidoreductase [uncultured Roseobacter sp.]